MRGFGSRTVSAGLITAGFAAFACADWIGLAGAKPSWWLLPVAFAIAFGGAEELVRLLAARKILVPAWFVRLAVVAMVLAAAAGAGAFVTSPSPLLSPMAVIGWPAMTLVLAMAVLFVMEMAVYVPRCGALERLTAAVFAMAFLGLPLACIVGLRLLHAEHGDLDRAGRWQAGMLPLVSLVVVAKAGDIAAYVGGTLLGRHRMAPGISPGKTWEGAAASLAGSSAAAWVVLESFGNRTMGGPWGGWACFGICVGLAAMAGDLAESLLKRECGAKDSGNVLGGLGGLLDLVDSLLFAAPVAWMLWLLGAR